MKTGIGMVEVREALARIAPERAPAAEMGDTAARHAAVALVFCGEASAPVLCLIRRAERMGDPWSGQMAFPGGKMEPEDADLRETAQRETAEEVGLVLEGQNYLGALHSIPLRPRGEEVGLRLFSYVYDLGRVPLPALLCNGEVAEVLWMPLSHALAEGNHLCMPLRREGALLYLPALAYGSYRIWGLTYRILSQLYALLQQPFPELAGAQRLT